MPELTARSRMLAALDRQTPDRLLYGGEYCTVRDTIRTPRGRLTAVKQSNEHTDWLVEHPVKQKADFELIAHFLPPIRCDAGAVNREAEAFGERGIVRGAAPGFRLFGQPGCWQDAACLIGTQRLILATYDAIRVGYGKCWSSC